MEMVLTLFDGAVMTGCIPASIESGDERTFITSYSERVIAPALIGHDPKCQDSIDDMLSQFVNQISEDHSNKMKKLARNVNWATSVAVCKAGAYASNMDSYKYVRKLLVCHEPEYKGQEYDIPDCVFSITNSAMHPTITSTQQVSVGLDVGASQFYECNDSYRFRCSDGEDDANLISTKALNDVYVSLSKECDLDYIEDAFHHTNWNYFSKLGYINTTATGEKWKSMGYYMLANRCRVCTSLLLKVSKAGSVTELIKFVTENKYRSFSFVMDIHSCDSSDTFIADLCVGLMVEKMKIGFSCVSRKCKVCDRVNQILKKVVAKIRFLGIVDGRQRLEIIDDPDTDEWDKPPSPIYD